MRLFGRERELELVHASISRASAGFGSLVRLSGEPGIGKTTLANAAFEHAQDARLRAVWVRAWRGAPAFDPVRSALDALGVPPAVGASREATFEAIRRSIALLGPTLVVIDDVHEADSDSLDLLAWLAPHLRATHVLVVVTERSASTGASTDVTAKLAIVARHSTTVEIGPLAQSAVRELIGHATALPVDDRLAEAIHRGTGGNALFVEGVVRAALRDGTLASGTLRFPRDVEQAIGQRVRDAGEGITSVLQVGAVVGRSFSPALLAAVLGRPQLDVTEQLELARAEALVVEDAGGRYAFRHPLVSEALAATLDARSRARLHAAVADALGKAASPAEIAHHHVRAIPIVSATRAIESCRRAAAAAAMSTAHDEDVRWRSSIVDLLEPSDLAGRAGAELELARAILNAGRREDARAALSRAADLARRTGDGEHLAEIALAYADTGEFGAHDASKLALLREALAACAPEAEVAVRARARLGAELWVASHTRDEAEALTRAAIDVARSRSNDDLLFYVLDARFQALWGPETLTERVRLAAELSELARAIDNIERRLSVSRRLLLLAAERGDVTGFERELAVFAELAGRLARPSLEETVLQRRLWLALVHGDLEAAARLTDDLFELGVRIQNPQAEMGRRFALSAIALARADHEAMRALTPGFSEDAARLPHLPFIRARLAQIAARSGDPAVATRELPRVVRDLQDARGGDLVTLAALSFAADAAAVLGDRESAQLLHPLLLPHRALFATIGASIGVGSVAHAIGLVERTLGDARAEASFREAIAFHRAMKAPLLVAATEREMGTPAPAAAPTQKAALVRDGDEIVLRWGTSEHRFKASRGLEHLATLLARPLAAIHVLELAGARPMLGAGGPRERSIDARARAAYGTRLIELREREAELAQHGDSTASARVRLEREALEDEIAQAARPRASDAGEKARVAVAKALRRAIDAIAEVAPSAGDHLRRYVRTGYECSYDPPPDLRISWDVTV